MSGIHAHACVREHLRMHVDRRGERPLHRLGKVRVQDD